MKKTLNTIFKKRSYHYEHNIFTPHKDWTVIFIVFSLFLIGISVFNFFIFYQIDTGEGFITNIALMKVETINRSTLRDIIGVFDARAEEFSELKSNKPLNPDPTL